MNDVKALTEALSKPFPKEAIKKREGARGKMLDYVETHTVIHRLIEATDNQWSLSVNRLEKQGNVLVAVVELTIPGLGTRSHIGVQAVAEKSGEDLIKGAISDGLKKAATLFGVGLELYGPDYEGIAESKSAATTPARPAPAPPSAPPVNPPAQNGHTPSGKGSALAGNTLDDVFGPSPNTLIQRDQAIEICDLLKETGANVESFKRHFGIPAIEDLTIEQYPEARRMLLTKAAKLAQNRTGR